DGARLSDIIVDDRCLNDDLDVLMLPVSRRHLLGSREAACFGKTHRCCFGAVLEKTGCGYKRMPRSEIVHSRNDRIVRGHHRFCLVWGTPHAPLLRRRILPIAYIMKRAIMN